ncbi:hypothetical protein DFH27DRAFT_386290 [Peziza echinospora]|nr:hypothetical protein DFH27DRAFT_386290 [Peziza echinospora]
MNDSTVREQKNEIKRLRGENVAAKAKSMEFWADNQKMKTKIDMMEKELHRRWEMISELKHHMNLFPSLHPAKPNFELQQGELRKAVYIPCNVKIYTRDEYITFQDTTTHRWVDVFPSMHCPAHECDVYELDFWSAKWMDQREYYAELREAEKCLVCEGVDGDAIGGPRPVVISSAVLGYPRQAFVDALNKACGVVDGDGASVYEECRTEFGGEEEKAGVDTCVETDAERERKNGTANGKEDEGVASKPSSSSNPLSAPAPASSPPVKPYLEVTVTTSSQDTPLKATTTTPEKPTLPPPKATANITKTTNASEPGGKENMGQPHNNNNNNNNNNSGSGGTSGEITIGYRDDQDQDRSCKPTYPDTADESDSDSKFFLNSDFYQLL